MVKVSVRTHLFNIDGRRLCVRVLSGPVLYVFDHGRVFRLSSSLVMCQAKFFCLPYFNRGQKGEAGEEVTVIRIYNISHRCSTIVSVTLNT